MGEEVSIRLNRFIAMCGVCSRRKADLLIESGQISINKKIITSLGEKVNNTDNVYLNGKKINIENRQYLLLNKPKDHITTVKDNKGRKTVMMLIENACDERLFPVGRLDKNTTGLLLFTNDGELAKKLSHPRYEIKKIYHVTLNKNMPKNILIKIQKGLNLDDGFVKVDSISYIENNHKKIELAIHSGKNRIIRRIFEFLNYTVMKLDRVEYSFLTKNKLQIGNWRFLTQKELKELKLN
jgi:23S rRNA pseudouridine2605 synthase